MCNLFIRFTAILFQCWLFLYSAFSDITPKIYQSSSIVNSTSTQQLMLRFTNVQIPTGSYVQLQYTTSWNIINVGGGNTTDYCETGCTISNVIIQKNVPASTIQIKNIFPRNISIAQSRVVRYSLKNIVNPIYANSYSILITLYDNTSSMIEANTVAVKITAKQISCTLTRNATVVSSIAQYKFTINPGTVTFPSNLNILMAFPAGWSNSAEAGTYNSTSLCRGSPNPLVSCSVVNGKMNAINVLTGSTNSQFSLNITDIKNPGSQEINNDLSLQFYSSGLQLAFCTIAISGSTAKSIPDLLVSVPGSLGDVSIGYINFTLTEKSKTTDLIQVQFPKQYNCTLLYVAFIYLNEQSASRSASVHLNSSSSTLNVITFAPFFVDSTALYRIELYNIRIPRTSKIISSIKLTIIRDGSLVATQQCCSTRYNPLNQVTGISVTLSNNLVGSSSTHFVSINNLTSPNFPNDYTYILLEFDSKYSIVNPTYNCYIRNSLSIINPLTCTRNSSTMILISNINSSNLIGNTLFSIGIDNIVTPVTISPLHFSLITLDSNYDPIQNISASYTLQATKINNVKVVTSTSITYDIVSYTFTITNTNTIPPNSVVIIHFPPQIHLNASDPSFCFLNGTQLLTTNCLIDFSNLTSAQILVNISNSISIPFNDLNKTNITISKVTNPLSIRKTSSFIIQIVNSLGNIIQELDEGIFVVMASVKNNFDYLYITASDNHTMAITTYSVTFKIPVDIYQDYANASSYTGRGIQIKIKFPSQYSCDNNLVSSTCLVSQQNQTLTFSLNQTSNSVNYSFTVPGIVNPSITSLTSNIIVSLFLSDYLSIQQNYNGLQAFEPSSLRYTLNQSNYLLNQVVNIYITIQKIDNFKKRIGVQSIVIFPPSEYSTTSNISITSNDPNSLISKVLNGTKLQSIKIDGILTPINLSISISNIINPLSAPSVQKWSLQYRSSASNKLIALSNQTLNNFFDTKCQLPCRQCMTANLSYCTSCYSNVLSITQKYLQGSICVANNCSTRQFLSLVQSKCLTCSSNCQSCLNTYDNCTSCPVNSSTFLYSPTSKCVSSCPPQYYEDNVGLICSKCLAPCLYCSGSSGQVCQYCLSTFVLTKFINGSTLCSNNCFGGYFNKSNICQKCSSNCSTCIQYDNCTLCLNSTYLLNGFCFQFCPSGYYISIMSGNQTCDICGPPCLTCVGFSTYCTSCNLSLNTNKYLTSIINWQTCSSGCSSSSFPNEDFVCINCLYPCGSCISLTQCSSCVSGYFYNPRLKTCHSSCPNKTILISVNQTCLQCISPCLQCTSTITRCTSCIQGYFLDSVFSTCNLTCNLPYFAIDRKCTRCADPCGTCAFLKPYICTTCQSGYFQFGTNCYPGKCPDTTFQPSGSTICSACTSGCLNCINSSTTCLSCFPGLYLYQQSCIPTCPTTPQRYFQYQMQCILCQPQCLSCISSPIQCASCANSSFYLNEMTRQCNSTCTPPFFAGSISSINYCIKCKLPCKSCTTSYDRCSSCYNGRYLLNEACVQDCGNYFYANTENNNCIPCSVNCITCLSEFSCTVCVTNSYFYIGGCYTSCPAQAPHTYLNKYCRNCTLDNCIICDNSLQSICLFCEPGYILHNKKCYLNCPDGYEADEITKTLCILTQQTALVQYLTFLERYKVYLFPGTILLFFTASIVFLSISTSQQALLNSTTTINTNYVHIMLVLTSFPQFICCLCYLIYLAMYPDRYYLSNYLNLLVYILFSIYCLLNILQFILAFRSMKQDDIFNKWSKQKEQKNQRRYLIVMIFSLIFNKKLIFLLFSGLWRIPTTCCQISPSLLQSLSKKLKIFVLLTILAFEVPLFSYIIYSAFVENYSKINYKLFYATIDQSIILLISIITEIVFLAKQFSVPKPYKKYILQGISSRSIAALTEQNIEGIITQEENNNLHRSNSAEGLRKQSQQMNAIEYLSAFDTREYQDPEFVDSDRINGCIQQGKYRKQNLKKKKKNYNVGLDTIEEDSDESDKKNKKQRKKKVEKVKKAGYLNNFIYWKPVENKEKQKPEKQFKLHEKQIMNTIKEKESDFDLITKNDIIFQDEIILQNQSFESDPDDFYVEDSRRALNFQYQAFLNKNYAKKMHMG